MALPTGTLMIGDSAGTSDVVVNSRSLFLGLAFFTFLFGFHIGWTLPLLLCSQPFLYASVKVHGFAP